MTLFALDFGLAALIGIVVGGVANFMLGGLWYMTLFNKPWMAATGRVEEDFKNASPGPGMILTLMGCVVTTAVLAAVYQWAGGETLLDGLMVGFLLGIGVAAVERAKTAVYCYDERTKPWALYAVDASYSVCGLALSGMIYALIA